MEVDYIGVAISIGVGAGVGAGLSGTPLPGYLHESARSRLRGTLGRGGTVLLGGEGVPHMR